ncbi:MAG: MBL fold metallo-hydrolase [Deltaproteobacteria bacterium]|nr:MBL fold metallo-hydrolase [Deltaproteobacteria bacterium]
MSQVQLRFLGSGDAFGSGGRCQTCILLEGASEPLLIDGGASSLMAMKSVGVDPAEISWIVLSHLHGDHFAGIPFLILDGQFNRRERPLCIAGPPGVRERVEAAMEVLFPGSSRVTQRFAVEFVELQDRVTISVGPAVVTPFLVQHACGAPPYALRIEYGGKVITYSGDTEWTESLVDAAQGADLFICEAYFFEKKIRYHLDYQTLLHQRDRLECRRLILTHMSQDMLSRRAELEIDCAEDGRIIVL